MILQTRYRDIPWEEAAKCQPSALDRDISREFWSEVRGKPVAVHTPAVDSVGSRRIICDQPKYRVVGEWSLLVCPHIAEIGD